MQCMAGPMHMPPLFDRNLSCRIIRVCWLTEHMSRCGLRMDLRIDAHKDTLLTDEYPVL